MTFRSMFEYKGFAYMTRLLPAGAVFDRRIFAFAASVFLSVLVCLLFGQEAVWAQNELPASVQSPKPNPPKTFLLVLPQNGPLVELGRQARQGAELALKTWGGGFNLEVAPEEGGAEEIDYTKVALVIGYFTETSFQQDAPRYLYLKKPVILPYLTNPEAAARGPYSFFRLMPDYDEQGRFMAMEILAMKTRPSRILIIQGAEDNQATLVENLVKTLSEPIQPEAPQVEEGKKPPKAPPKIKPLDSKAKIVTVNARQALEPDSIVDFGKRTPELIILAIGLPDALRLAPVLAESKFAKTPMWGGVMLGLRETGAAYASLKLRLSLCLPAVSLIQSSPKTLIDFKNRYVATWRTQPTWISVLAFDSMNIAIKAATSVEENGGDLAGYLSAQAHYCLGTYELTPGGRGGGKLPMAMMPVRAETIGYLP